MCKAGLCKATTKALPYITSFRQNILQKHFLESTGDVFHRDHAAGEYRRCPGRRSVLRRREAEVRSFGNEAPMKKKDHRPSSIRDHPMPASSMLCMGGSVAYTPNLQDFCSTWTPAPSPATDDISRMKNWTKTRRWCEDQDPPKGPKCGFHTPRMNRPIRLN